MKSATHLPNFDRVAHIYQWAEYFAMGNTLQRIRTHFVSFTHDRRHALVLGDGDGRFLAELLRRNAFIHGTAVDTSKKMLSLLAQRCGNFQERLQTSLASALDFIPARETDLIVSHFFLDCLEQQDVERLIEKIARSCKPGTQWLISDFQEPSGTLFRPIGKLYISLLYAAFRVLTALQVNRLPQTRGALEAAGFRRIAYHQTLGGLLYTEVWELGSG